MAVCVKPCNQPHVIGKIQKTATCVGENENERPKLASWRRLRCAPGSTCIQPARMEKASCKRFDKGSVGRFAWSSSVSCCVGAVVSCSCWMEKFPIPDHSVPGKSVMIAVPTRR